MAGAAHPTTTIIIPAFNAAKTIARTLTSVVRQPDRAWQALVVDDGSTDDTAAIVRRWAMAEPRIRLIAQPNRGAAAARNRGLGEAGAAWTLFLDADDTIDRRYLARMHRRLRADPAAGAVCCGYVRRSAAGAVIARYPAPRLDGDPLAICERGPPTAMHAIVSRTALLRSLGGFDTGLATNEDWDLWWRMARAGTRFAVEPRQLAYYWCAGGSLTRNGAAMLRDTLTMLARTAPDGRVPTDAVMTALLWNGGCAIGGGGDGLALPPLVDASVASMPIVGAVDALAEGLVLGLGKPFAALLPGWPALGPRVAMLLDQIGQRAGSPGFAAAMARGIERMVIRTGHFRRPVLVGRTLGLMLLPRHLLRGIAPVRGSDRVVVKVPLVRPRSLLMIEADLADGLSGAAVRRLLAARLRGGGR